MGGEGRSLQQEGQYMNSGNKLNLLNHTDTIFHSEFDGRSTQREKRTFNNCDFFLFFYVQTERRYMLAQFGHWYADHELKHSRSEAPYQATAAHLQLMLVARWSRGNTGRFLSHSGEKDEKKEPRDDRSPSFWHLVADGRQWVIICSVVYGRSPRLHVKMAKNSITNCSLPSSDMNH